MGLLFKQLNIFIMNVLTYVPQTNMNGKAHRKENAFDYAYVGIAIVDHEVKEVVDLRIYSTSARNYCCVWIRGEDRWGSGSDFAGGYGYHRPSAAADSAIRKAGVELSDDISGRGDDAIERAVEAITKHLYPNALIHVVKAHG